MIRIEPNSNTLISNCIDFEQISQMVQDLWARIERFVERFFQNLRNNFCPRVQTVERVATALLPERPATALQPQTEITSGAGIAEAESVDFKFWRETEIYNQQLEVGYCSLIEQPAVPLLGERGPGTAYCPCKICVKLPLSQLEFFPQAIRERFQDLPEENVDLYVMAFEDQRDWLPPGTRRNMLFHSWAYRDARMNLSSDDLRSRRVWANLQETCEMGFFEPQNVISYEHSHPAIPFGQFKDLRMHLGMSIYNNGPVMVIGDHEASFRMDSTKAWGSFYTAARQGNRAVAALCVLIRDNTHPQVAAFCNPHNNLASFREQVSATVESNLKQKILNLITPR